MKAILNFRTLLDVDFVFQPRRQFLADIGQGLPQGGAQLAPLTGRHGKQTRPVRIVKVVHIQQIRRRRGFARPRREKLAQQVGAPEIGFPRKIDVVAGRPDMQGKLQRLERAGLGRDPALTSAGNGVARVPRNAIRGQHGAQALTRQRADGSHEILFP